MNLNVDSFCQIDYSDNESVKSDYSNCSSVASVSSQLSTAGFHIVIIIWKCVEKDQKMLEVGFQANRACWKPEKKSPQMKAVI